MEFNIENLKRRSQQVAEETRPGKNTSTRIGEIFYDIVCEIENVYRKINRRNFILSYCINSNFYNLSNIVNF